MAVQETVEQGNTSESVMTKDDAEMVEQTLPETESYPSYDQDNPELDALLAGADDSASQNVSATAKSAQVSGIMSKEEASKLAVTGIIKGVEWAREQSGEDLKISKATLGICGTLMTPVVMKYGNTIKDQIDKLTSGAIEQDSYMPEVLATVGVVGVGGSLFLQNKKAKKQRGEEKTEVQKTQEESTVNGD